MTNNPQPELSLSPTGPHPRKADPVIVVGLLSFLLWQLAGHKQTRAGRISENYVMQKAEVRPDWGHPILTPEGREIRVPRHALEKLDRLGVKLPSHSGVPRLHPSIYGMLRREFDCITDGLRHLLGEDLSGPAWLVCRCRECQRRASDSDQTLDPVTARSRAGMLADDAIASMRKGHHR